MDDARKGDAGLGRSTPGQTPLDDISGLRLKGIRTQQELNAAEAENIRRATVKYLARRVTPRSARFDVAWSKRLHEEMFGQVWMWAGEIRKRELNLGSPAHVIETDLHNLFEDLRAWETSGMTMMEQAVRLHHGAVRIHPFVNGNGRWSRMLGNIWLKMHGAALVAWPEQAVGTASVVRNEYLEAVRAADRGEFGALMGLHERFA